jgi:hypothetical protein
MTSFYVLAFVFDVCSPLLAPLSTMYNTPYKHGLTRRSAEVAETDEVNVTLWSCVMGPGCTSALYALVMIVI